MSNPMFGFYLHSRRQHMLRNQNTKKKKQPVKKKKPAKKQNVKKDTNSVTTDIVNAVVDVKKVIDHFRL